MTFICINLATDIYIPPTLTPHMAQATHDSSQDLDGWNDLDAAWTMCMQQVLGQWVYGEAAVQIKWTVGTVGLWQVDLCLNNAVKADVRASTNPLLLNIAYGLL